MQNPSKRSTGNYDEDWNYLYQKEYTNGLKKRIDNGFSSVHQQAYHVVLEHLIRPSASVATSIQTM
jgi:hypothetical protein